MQILPGIYLANGSPYGRHQNSYLVHAQDATFLVDSGDLHDAETLPEIERNIARWGFRLEDVSHLCITHAHFDHASHAADLQKRGIKIVGSPATAEAMAVGDDRCIGFAVQRRFRPCLIDTLISDGGVLSINGLKITCHAAPGHCNGHVVYELILNGECIWFTGDLFEAQHAHMWINLPWTGDPAFDKSKYINSLSRLLELPPCDHILPGHGPAVIGNAYRVLQMIYAEAMTKWR